MIFFTKRSLVNFLVFSLVLATMQSSLVIRKALADSPQSVVINEIAWAGSIDNSNDEWIELYNPTSQDVNLAGWKIIDDVTSTYQIASGTIKAGSYFLIEDSEVSVNSITADAIIGLSLANTGDTLELQNASSTRIDIVNSSGGVWFAGDNTTKTSMERIDSAVSGDINTNWKSNTSPSGASGSNGSLIAGTPRTENSAQAPNQEPVFMVLSVDNPTPKTDDVVTVSGQIFAAIDLFSYGTEINYNPAVLDYQSATVGQFLSASSQVSTTFQADLENGQEGRLIVAEARTQTDSKTGISGDGQLFTVKFKVIGANSTQSTITLGENSFAATAKADLTTTLQNTEITVSDGGSTPGSGEGVTNASVTESDQRYALDIAWSAPGAGADKYLINKKQPDGTFKQIGETTTTNFTDKLNIVPNLTYDYQIISVKSQNTSQPVTTSGKDTRGLSGDNNRSDRVDGRDLQELAEHFGENDQSTSFMALIDTTYDGRIDGNDLIDIAANWAKTFAQN